MDFELDYTLFVFVAALGLFQVVAGWNGLEGLLLVRPRSVAKVVGAALVIGAFTWFFGTETRNLPDTSGGLDGPQQAGYFTAAAGSALLVTLALSSLLNFRRANGVPGKLGLDDLRDTTYLHALGSTVGTWGKKWQRWTKRYFSG